MIIYVGHFVIKGTFDEIKGIWGIIVCKWIDDITHVVPYLGIV